MQKQWWKSKAIWGGLLTCASGVLAGVGAFLNGQLDVNALIQQVIPLIGMGLGIIGIRVRI